MLFWAVLYGLYVLYLVYLLFRKDRDSKGLHSDDTASSSPRTPDGKYQNAPRKITQGDQEIMTER